MKDNVCLQEILNACIGLDEERHPNSGVIIHNGKYFEKRNEIEMETQRNLISPEVGLMVTPDYLIVELTFNTSFDLEFRSLWSLLDKYGKKMNGYCSMANPEWRPYFKMTIVPFEFEGRFAIEMLSPAFWHLSDKNEGDKFTTFTMFFPSKGYQFIETQGYDTEELFKQLYRQQETVAVFEAKEAQRQLDAEDEDSYEKRMERAREQLRHDKSQW